jgi:hypothetical protein
MMLILYIYPTISIILVLSGLYIYLLSILVMVIIYHGIIAVMRIRPNSYLGELF